MKMEILLKQIVNLYIMRNLTFFITFIFAYSAFAQNFDIDRSVDILKGTWEYKNGNEIFRIVLYENNELNELDGDYYLYEVDSNNNETLIHNSNRLLGSTGLNYPSLITLYGVQNNRASGMFYDNVLHGNGQEFMKSGWCSVEIMDNPCNGCVNQTTLNWKVFDRIGLKYKDYPFNVPDDIIMTKITN